MGPLQTEVAALEEVGAPFLTGLVVGKIEGEVTVEFVINLVSGVDIKRPGTQGEDVAGDRQVKILAQYEIHAQVAEVETAGAFLAEGRHQQAGGALRAVRDKAEGQEERDFNAFDNRMGRTENRLLGGLCDDFRETQLHVIVGLVQVAHRIAAAGDADRPVGGHLDALALNESFRLLGDHVFDLGLFAVEIVADLLHVIGLAILGHNRLPLPFPGKGVVCASGKDRSRFHVVLHVVGREFHVAVGDGHISVVEGLAGTFRKNFNDGVLGTGESRAVQRALAHQVGGIGPGGQHGIPPERIQAEETVALGQACGIQFRQGSGVYLGNPPPAASVLTPVLGGC